MPSKKDEAGKTARAFTDMSSFMPGANPDEMVGAVAMMLRSTMQNPVTTAKAHSFSSSSLRSARPAAKPTTIHGPALARDALVQPSEVDGANWTSAL